MKNIIKLLDKAIEDLDASYKGTRYMYEESEKKVVELKADLMKAWEEVYASRAEIVRLKAAIERLEDLAVTTAQKLDQKEYEKAVEEVSNRGE